MSKQHKRPKPLVPRPAPDFKQDFAPLKGYLARGPQYEQGFRGWEVHVEKSFETDIPVTIIPGHVDG